jgi:hypothetical protein
MQIAAGERVTLARGIGPSLEATWTVTAGSVEVLGAGLALAVEDARDHERWAEAREAMLTRIRTGVALGEVTEAQAAALERGDTSMLDVDQLALVRAWLGRDPVPVTQRAVVDAGGGTLTVEAGGPETGPLRVALVIEAIGGPAGATLSVGAVSVA